MQPAYMSVSSVATLILAGLALVALPACPEWPPAPGGDGDQGEEPCQSVDPASVDRTNPCEGLGDDDNGSGASAQDGQPPLPAKTINFELIGIHDPDSENYDADCIGCHGNRFTELALDGTTKAAHAGMADGLENKGSKACTVCHGAGTNFLTASAGGLRQQTSMDKTICALSACHGASGPRPFYAVDK